MADVEPPVTDENADELPEVEPTPTAKKHGPRAAIAAGVAVVLVAGAVWIAASTRKDDGRLRPLALFGASTNHEARAGTADAMYPARSVEYSLAGSLPDLSATAPVYRLVAPGDAHDTAARIAEALGNHGDVRDIEGGAAVTGNGYVVNVFDASGLQVSVWRGDASSGVSSAGGSSGSSGSGSGNVGSGSTPGTGSLAVPPDTPISDDAKPVAPETVTTPSIPPQPKHLPTAAEAEKIAREFLDRMGLLEGNDWGAEVNDSGTVGVAIACDASRECPEARTIVTSRGVTLYPIIDGHRVTGIAWYVEIGDQGVVQSINGAAARFERVDDYPLRPIKDVYDDIAGGKWQEIMPLGAEDEAARNGVATPETAIAPSPPPQPVPIRVAVTGAQLGTMLMSGFENDTTRSFAVPSYRFTGRYDTGEPWEAELMALSPDYVTTPSTTVPTAKPLPEPRPEPAPLPAPRPNTEPAPNAPTPATTGPATPNTTGTLELYVSNQSFEVTPVDIVVTLDGTPLVKQQFDTEQQHTWKPFSFDVTPGVHKLAVTAHDGKVQKDLALEKKAGTLYGIVTFWGTDGIDLTTQDTPPAFQ